MIYVMDRKSISREEGSEFLAYFSSLKLSLSCSVYVLISSFTPSECFSRNLIGTVHQWAQSKIVLSKRLQLIINVM
jgi:hypothetical protein